MGNARKSYRSERDGCTIGREALHSRLWSCVDDEKALGKLVNEQKYVKM
jgi:hypothetical protein